MAWKVCPIFPIDDDSVHIFPTEGEAHRTDPKERDCWCVPRLEENEHGVMLVIHRLPD